jgi:DNA-binding Xre family transcriptional regulator
MADSQARRPPQLELPDGRVAGWRLRELMAAKGLFSAVQLQQALGEQGVKIGPSQAHELMTRAPRQPRMEVLFALCQILECVLGDLWVLDQAATPPAAERIAAGARGRLAHLKPVSARLDEGRPS